MIQNTIAMACVSNSYIGHQILRSPLNLPYVWYGNKVTTLITNRKHIRMYEVS